MLFWRQVHCNLLDPLKDSLRPFGPKFPKKSKKGSPGHKSKKAEKVGKKGQKRLKDNLCSTFSLVKRAVFLVRLTSWGWGSFPLSNCVWFSEPFLTPGPLGPGNLFSCSFGCQAWVTPLRGQGDCNYYTGKATSRQHRALRNAILRWWGLQCSGQGLPGSLRFCMLSGLRVHKRPVL